MSQITPSPYEATQWTRLGAVVPAWLREIPMYQRAATAGASADLDYSQPDAFRSLPFISKADLRPAFPQGMLRPGVQLDDLLAADKVEVEHTAGTSAERTPLLLGRGWWADQERRALRLNPFIASVLEAQPEARRVTLTSPVCNNDICYTGRPSRDDRIVGRALHVNLTRHPFLWSPEELARMAGEAVEWSPTFLDVDPVYGALFARYCEQHHIRLPSLRFVLSSYEFLSVIHRRCLERVFGVPVFNLYGSTETGHLLMEDSDGNLVPSDETAFLELLDADARGIGELVVTTLTNDYMPLIRYRIGDLTERWTGSERPHYRLHGRAADSARRSDGSRVTVRDVDDCFAGLAGMLHYEVAEEDPGNWRVRIASDGQVCPETDLRILIGRLHALLGGVEAPRVEWTDTMMAQGSGKFRLLRAQVH